MLTPGSFWEDKGHCILLRDDQTLCNDILLLLQTAAIPDAHLDQYLTQREGVGNEMSGAFYHSPTAGRSLHHRQCLCVAE